MASKAEQDKAKGLDAAAKRYHFEVPQQQHDEAAPLPEPQVLPQLDQLPVKRQPRALQSPLRTIPYRRSR
jgi:hypothetical protein